MQLSNIPRLVLFLPIILSIFIPRQVLADGNVHKVKHIIVVMQENHSFDNYFGALAYAPSSPYHTRFGGCRKDDHTCVDGLSCKMAMSGNLTCFNSNVDDNGSTVFAFHDSRRCALPDLNQSWFPTHQEANFFKPNEALQETLSDGFVRVNDATQQLDNGVENPTDDQTMGFYNQDEIPFYYNLAENFAVNDRYFSSVLGPTFPNRAYFMAATSFGHLTTNDEFPPPGGYRPITGTIFDLFDKNKVTWADYFQDAPQGGSYRLFGATGVDPHFLPLNVFLAQAAGVPGLGPLPQVALVDPNFGFFGRQLENDDHPLDGYTERAGLRFSSHQRGAQRALLGGFGHLHYL